MKLYCYILTILLKLIGLFHCNSTVYTDQQTKLISSLLECSVNEIQSGIVKTILKGHRLLLHDGRIIHLADIVVPNKLSGQKNPLFFVLGKRVTPYLSMHNKDRFGHWRAQLIVNEIKENAASNPIWLQADLLQKGDAYLYLYPDVLSCFDKLYKMENQARKAQRGIWASQNEKFMYHAYDPNLLDRSGRYSLVWGRIVSVGETSHWTYLNFGYNWDRDFTVRMTKEVQKQLQKQGLKIKSLTQKYVEIRGVIQINGGPQIDVFDSQQIMIQY